MFSEDSVEGWTPISGSTGTNVTSVDILVSPKQIKLVKAFLKCNSITYTTTILDLQRAIGTESILKLIQFDQFVSFRCRKPRGQKT